eukprot:CAMPEP_0180331724 /NCGR_PEP_ID=MMETSP0988-20121125/42102_1 /TAXON_ID=697907 /ORGANISM="non described non described, Strain CCMP2293" /LENGTH=148 /DNA_ID=CAMNT_0022319223 /DNA_START=624 /DNA_END=1066 /DNA_ORIENTATION=+
MYLPWGRDDRAQLQCLRVLHPPRNEGRAGERASLASPAGADEVEVDERRAGRVSAEVAASRVVPASGAISTGCTRPTRCLSGPAKNGQRRWRRDAKREGRTNVAEMPSDETLSGARWPKCDAEDRCKEDFCWWWEGSAAGLQWYHVKL